MAKILVVDDHKENRGVLTTLLQYAGHEMVEASDGEQAFEEARTLGPDLVITDILMPNVDGWKLLQALRSDSHTCKTPVIFYSAMHLSREARDTALNQGVAGILCKPIEPRAVLELVDKTLCVGGDTPLTVDSPIAGSELDARLKVLSSTLWQKVQELEDTRADLEGQVSSRNTELEAANLELQREVADRRQAEVELRSANEQLIAKAADLEQRTDELRLLTEIGELLQACEDAAEARNVIKGFARKLFSADSGALYFVREYGNGFDAFATWGSQADNMQQTMLSEECWGLRRGRPHLVSEGTSSSLCRHMPSEGLSTSVCVPMMSRGHTVGVLHISCYQTLPIRDASHTESTRRLALALADTASLALSNIRLRERLKEQSVRDSLTGLFNRRYLEESLDREVSRARRAGSHIGVIMLDIDHFKKLNDSFGHPAGDAVLRSLGQFLRSRVRPEDIPTRYGGEEFVLILPGASLDISCQRAESFRTAVRSIQWPPEVPAADIQNAITLSLGVAEFPKHGTNSTGVLRAADEALYLAKSSGRDCVRTAVSGKGE